MLVVREQKQQVSATFMLPQCLYYYCCCYCYYYYYYAFLISSIFFGFKGFSSTIVANFFFSFLYVSFCTELCFFRPSKLWNWIIEWTRLNYCSMWGISPLKSGPSLYKAHLMWPGISACQLCGSFGTLQWSESGAGSSGCPELSLWLLFIMLPSSSSM